MKRSSKRTIGVCFATWAVAGVLSASQWSGAVDGNWSTVGNWDAVPESGGVATFGLPTGGTTVYDLASSFFLQTLLIGNEAGAFSFTGTDPLPIVSSLTDESAAAQTFAVPVRLGAVDGESATVSVTDPAGDLTVNDLHVMVPELVKAGAGRLTVSDGAVADSKTTRIASGTFRIATPRTGAGVPVTAVTATEVRIWRNVKLSEVWGVTALANGAWWHGPTEPFFFVYNASSDTATVEFQGYDGGYTKGSCVTFRQVGDDVWAKCTNMRNTQKNGTQSTGYLGYHVSEFSAAGNNYFPGFIEPTCYKPVYLTTAFQPVWKNVNLADVKGCAAFMAGGALNPHGWNPADGYYWNYNSAAGTATAQIQIVHGGFLKGVIVELRQNGANVEARASDARYKNGAKLGTNVSNLDRGTVATSIEGGGYAVYALRPIFDEVKSRIVIENGGCLDVNANQTGAVFAESELTHGREIEVSGSGPDGQGALYNSVLDGWGCTFGRVILKGDALAGGGSMDVRPLADSAVAASAGEACVEGPFALTTSCSRFGIADATLAVEKLVVTNGLLVLANTVSGAVTNGIHFVDGSRSSIERVTLGKDIPLVVDAGVQASMLVDANPSTFAGDLTVGPGAVLSVTNRVSLTVNGTVMVDGALSEDVTSAQPLFITGTLVGGGVLAGPFVRFAGDASCWTMEVNDEGWTRKIDASGVTDADFLAGLKRIDVTFTGTLGGVFEIMPVCTLTAEQIANIVLEVKSADGIDVAGCRLALEEGKFMLKIGDDTIPRHVFWTNALGDDDLFNPANWACTNDFNRAITALPTIDSTVHLPDGCVFNCTNGAPLVFKELVLPSSIGGDCDWRGLTGHVTGTVNLNGHKLLLSGFPDEFTVTDGNAPAYARLEYIESCNANQYINTGWCHRAYDRVEGSVLILPHALDRVCPGIFGNCCLQGNAVFDMQFVSASRTVYYNRGYNVMVEIADFDDFVNRRIDFACEGTYAMWTDGVTTNVFTHTEVGGNSPSPMMIFQLNSSTAANGVATHENWGALMRLYGFRIISDGVVVRDFVPVVRLSDNAVGLLDLAAHDDQNYNPFYGNSGSEHFLAGPRVGFIPEETGTAGEVHIDVPEGCSATNEVVTFSGTLKVVKEGRGTFVAVKRGQTYFGGTEVVEGVFACGTVGSLGIYGAWGSPFTVRTGGVFDVNAYNDHGDYPFILDGGTLRNSVDAVGSSGWAWFTGITLTKDSFIESNNFGLIGLAYSPTQLNLNGHTLTLDILPSRSFYMFRTTVTGGGRILARTGGTLELGGKVGKSDLEGPVASDTILEVDDVALKVYNDSVFGNYMSHYTGDSGNQMPNALIRTESFTPGLNARFQRTSLANGGMLDLSEQTTTWVSTCVLEQSSVTNFLSFADDATTIRVKLPAHVKSDSLVVDWKDHVPTNWASIKFVSADDPKFGRSFLVTSDGLYLQRGLTLFLR